MPYLIYSPTNGYMQMTEGDIVRLHGREEAALILDGWTRHGWYRVF